MNRELTEKLAKFGNAEIARKMAAQFGTGCKSIPVELIYTKEVSVFLLKIEEAHQKAAESTLSLEAIVIPAAPARKSLQNFL